MIILYYLTDHYYNNEKGAIALVFSRLISSYSKVTFSNNRAVRAISESFPPPPPRWFIQVLSLPISLMRNRNPLSIASGCNRRRMAFGVIFQNNVRALQRGEEGSCRARVIHGGSILMQRSRLKAERALARNLKVYFCATSDDTLMDATM